MTSHFSLWCRFSSRQLAVMVRTCQLVVMTSKTCLPHSSTPWLHCRTWASIVAAPQASMYHHPPPGMRVPSLPSHHHQAALHVKLPACHSTLREDVCLLFGDVCSTFCSCTHAGALEGQCHMHSWRVSSIFTVPLAIVMQYAVARTGGLELYSALRCKYNGRLSVSRQAQLVQA